MITNPNSPPDSDGPMVIDDSDRYSRLKLIAWWEQKKIAAARILVVGAGALGNEVIKNLALMGIGEINIIDFDEVQESNLSRSVLFRASHEGQAKALVAAEMARDLNPDCDINPIVGDVLTDIGLGFIADMNLVICCVDNREARLWINRMCWKTNRPWIDGGIQEINGVAKVFCPPLGACYECAMTENDYRLISLRYSCPLLRKEDIQQGKVPTAPTIASIIGGLQVQEALKLIHKLPTAEGSALVFNGLANKFYQTRYPRRPDCLSHETYDEIIDLPLMSKTATAEELFRQLKNTTSGLDRNRKSWQILLDRDFLISLNCRNCGIERQEQTPLSQVAAEKGVCHQCAEICYPFTISEIECNSKLAKKTLFELGIPEYDIIKVSDGLQTVFVKLQNDSPKPSRSAAKASNLQSDCEGSTDAPAQCKVG